MQSRLKKIDNDSKDLLFKLQYILINKILIKSFNTIISFIILNI